MSNCRRCIHITGLHDTEIHDIYTYICLVESSVSNDKDFPFDGSKEVNCDLFIPNPNYPMVFTDFISKSVNKK